MEDVFLKLYTTRDLKRLFRRETDTLIDEDGIRRFREWLANNKFSNTRKIRLSYDFHIWLLCQLHQFSRLNFS